MYFLTESAVVDVDGRAKDVDSLSLLLFSGTGKKYFGSGLDLGRRIPTLGLAELRCRAGAAGWLWARQVPSRPNPFPRVCVL